MKQDIRYISILALLIAAVFTACSGGDPFGELWFEDAQISVEEGQRTLSFDTQRSASVLVSDPKSIGWQATTRDSWIKISNSSGTGNGSFSIEITQNNPESTVRRGTVEVRSLRSDRSTTISVEQAGSFITAPESVNFTAMSERKSITITSNVSWKMVKSPQWLSNDSTLRGNAGSTTFTLVSKDNTEETGNDDIITLQADNSNVTANIRVIREAVALTYQDFNGWFKYSGNEAHSLTIVSNSAWRITDAPSWLTFSQKSGTKNKTITVTAGANNGDYRDASFYVQSGNVKIYVWAGQEGKPTPDEGDNTTPQTSREE